MNLRIRRHGVLHFETHSKAVNQPQHSTTTELVSHIDWFISKNQLPAAAFHLRLIPQSDSLLPAVEAMREKYEGAKRAERALHSHQGD